MRRFRTTPLLALMFILSLVACAPAADPNATPGTSPGGDPDLLTQEQIMDTGLGNLYDVVQRLRPRWLAPRGIQSMGGGTVVGVYRGQNYLGGVDVLRTELASTASRLRFLDGSTATASLRAPGPGIHLAGAIVIEARR
jgi:hypothetical protein